MGFALRGSQFGSRDVGKPSQFNERCCERHGGELTVRLEADLSQGRPVYSELLCERQSGSKSLSLSLSLSLSFSFFLSFPRETSAWSSQSAPGNSTCRRPGYQFTRSI